MKINKKNLSFLLAILSMLLLTGNAEARGSYETAWSGLYPSSTLDTTYGCDLCHNSPYYTDIKDQLGGQTNVDNTTIIAAITDVEPLDSDGNSFTNIDEINHNTHPGIAASHPVLDTPGITDHSPSSPAYNAVGNERTFRISANQTVNVTWFINGSMVQFNESVTSAKYTNKSAAAGAWNVTALAENDYGMDAQKWDWIVTPQVSRGNIKADIEIKPETLNPASNGKITISIMLPRQYNAANIDFDKLTFQDAHPVGGHEIAKRNIMKVKFDRRDLENVPIGKHVALTVTGEVLHNGAWLSFEGRDTIRVINSAKDVEEDDIDENDDQEENSIKKGENGKKNGKKSRSQGKNSKEGDD